MRGVLSQRGDGLHAARFAAICAPVDKHPRIIALLAGLAAACGFAPFGLWPLSLVALAVLLALVARAPTIRRAALLGWLFGVGHFALGLNWIAGAFRFQDAMPVWFGWLAVVLLSLYLAVYPLVAAAVAKALAPKGGLPLALIFAGAWILTEYGRATLFTGFAWNPLGSIFVPTWIAGLSRLIGTYGLSGLAIVLAGAALLATENARARGPALAVVLVGVLGGWALLANDPGQTGKIVRIVQHNTSQAERHDSSHDEKSMRALERLTGKPGARPRLILWPEAAVPFFLEDEEWARDRVAALLGPQDMLLTGGDAFVYDAQRTKIVAAYNSVFVLDPMARLRGRYEKAHLVPYGEYLPMRPLLTAIGLSRLVPGDLDYWSGPGPRTYAIPGFGKAGIQICYEIIFSGQVIDARDRPDFLFNASTDAWFGAWGAPQHLAQAQLRAIEEGLPILRATPTGISAVIDSHGHLVAATGLDREAVIETSVPAAESPTPFALFGNILPLILALALGAGGVALARRRG